MSTSTLMALLALGISLATVLIAVWAARATCYQRIHEALVDPQAARGRKLAFVSLASGQWPSLESPEWDDLNQALALYDTLGVYVRRRYVPSGLVLENWSHPINTIGPAVSAFSEERARLGIRQYWTGYTYLAQRARGACSCSQCAQLRAI